MPRTSLAPLLVGCLALTTATTNADRARAEGRTKGASGTSPSGALTASQIVAKVVESDPWGFGGAEVAAKAVVTETSGKSRSLVFDAKSRRYAPPLGKSVITFQAPADVAGMKFLHIQNADADD
jgi:hypothetical protein